MPLAPAITDLEQLKERPAMARLLAWDPAAVEAAKFDRDELTIVVKRGAIREACAILRHDRELQFNFLADVTCVDWYPNEPRFDVVYHLLSIPRHQRLRLKVRLNGDDPSLESVSTSPFNAAWPMFVTM